MRIVAMVVTAAVLSGTQPQTGRADEPHWAFHPLELPLIPECSDDNWARNPIDRFVRARLDQEGIAPSSETERRTLMRRVSLDLIGLPPTAQDLSAFLSDDDPAAYERLIERLLASPQYGERWTRVWLDLCHYGDSDGHLTDQLRPVAWRYRDWVLHALNEGLPFDEFTVRQLAGDLLAEETRRLGGAGAESLAMDQILGTGFLRQTLSNREGGADLEEYRVEQIVDRTAMMGTIWLGLTVSCARCHDHKYDPLTQAEFFELYAYFDAADEVNIDAPLPDESGQYATARAEYEQQRAAIVEPYRDGLTELQQRWEAKLLYAREHPGENHVWDRQWELLGLIWGGGLGEGQLEGCNIVRLPWDQRTPRQQQDLGDYFLQHGAIVDEAQFTELGLGVLRGKLAALREQSPHAFPTRAPVMCAALHARQSYIHEVGDFRIEGLAVGPATPAWLPGRVADAPEQVSTAAGEAADRLLLARWLMSPENPLTARVTVNRMWQEFFGRGLSPTEDDFGLRGDPPSHPELLDWLAHEFMQSGWDVKHMHRLIVTSATYRQSSRPRPDVSPIDPGNELLARQTSLRVPAELVRDISLQVSGLLDRTLGGPGVFPPQDERVTMEAFGSNSWPVSTGADRYRRGVYTFVLRTSPYAQSIVFDAPAPVAVCTRRDRSNTPLQALLLLNDPVFYEMAAAFGRRILSEAGEGDAERIHFAFQIALGRDARPEEVERLRRYLELQREQGDCRAEAAIWTNLASVVLNLHEFITRD